MAQGPLRKLPAKTSSKARGHTKYCSGFAFLLDDDEEASIGEFLNLVFGQNHWGMLYRKRFSQRQTKSFTFPKQSVYADVTPH
jgi:hypothetical protein